MLRRQFQFHTFDRRPDRVRPDRAVAMQRDEEPGLGGTVELLQVDSEGAKKHQEIGIDRIAGRVGHAHLAHPKHVAERAAHQNIACHRHQPIADRSGFTGQRPRTDPPRDRHAVTIEALIEAAGLLHPERHLLGQRLEHARCGEEICRTHLAHIGKHGVGGFGATDAVANDHRLDITEEVLADPSGRQVGHRHVGVPHVPHRRGHARAIDQRGMGENDALGRAGRARCKEHEGGVLAGAARGLGLQEVTLFGGEFPALLQQGGVADKLRAACNGACRGPCRR